MATPFEANANWGDLDLQTSVFDFELQHLARLHTHFIAQALGHHNPPGGIDGSSHGRMLPRTCHQSCQPRHRPWLAGQFRRRGDATCLPASIRARLILEMPSSSSQDGKRQSQAVEEVDRLVGSMKSERINAPAAHAVNIH
jgi:hypothetical protein